MGRDLEGRGANDINSQYTKALQRTIVESKAIDMTSLCIIDGKYAWVLYLDVMVLDSGGNLYDSIVLAAYTALNNTR